MTFSLTPAGGERRGEGDAPLSWSREGLASGQPSHGAAFGGWEFPPIDGRQELTHDWAELLRIVRLPHQVPQLLDAPRFYGPGRNHRVNETAGLLESLLRLWSRLPRLRRVLHSSNQPRSCNLLGCSQGRRTLRTANQLHRLKLHCDGIGNVGSTELRRRGGGSVRANPRHRCHDRQAGGASRHNSMGEQRPHRVTNRSGRRRRCRALGGCTLQRHSIG